MSMSGGFGDRLPPREDWLERRVRALEQQVRELQAARHLQSSFDDVDFHYTGGSTFVHEDSVTYYKAGRSRWADPGDRIRRALGRVDRLGNADDDAYWGEFSFDREALIWGARHTSGTGVAERGLAMPGFPFAFTDRAVFNTPNDTTFWAAYEALIDWPVHEVLQVGAWAGTEGSGTGQARLYDTYSGAATSAVTIGPGEKWLRFSWLHPATCGYGDARSRITAVNVQLQLRRVTAGQVSGNQAYSYCPTMAMLVGRLQATDAATDGNPSWS